MPFTRLLYHSERAWGVGGCASMHHPGPSSSGTAEVIGIRRRAWPLHGLSWALAQGQGGALRTTQGGCDRCDSGDEESLRRVLSLASSLLSLIGEFLVSVMPMETALQTVLRLLSLLVVLLGYWKRWR